MSIEETRKFLGEQGLLKEEEPCGLIAEAFIHALAGNVNQAVIGAKLIILRYGLSNTQSEKSVEFYIKTLAEKSARWIEQYGTLRAEHVKQAYVWAQAVEALCSLINRFGTVKELKLSREDSLRYVLDFPEQLMGHFVKWSEPGHPEVKTGSEWARCVYGKIFCCDGHVVEAVA